MAYYQYDRVSWGANVGELGIVVKIKKPEIFIFFLLIYPNLKEMATRNYFIKIFS